MQERHLFLVISGSACLCASVAIILSFLSFHHIRVQEEKIMSTKDAIFVDDATRYPVRELAGIPADNWATGMVWYITAQRIGNQGVLFSVRAPDVGTLATGASAFTANTQSLNFTAYPELQLSRFKDSVQSFQGQFSLWRGSIRVLGIWDCVPYNSATTCSMVFRFPTTLDAAPYVGLGNGGNSIPAALNGLSVTLNAFTSYLFCPYLT